MTEPASTTRAIVFVAAEGLPDAWVVNDREVEVTVTQPDSPVEAVIVVPLDEARAWAADIYAAVTIAHREHTGDPTALTDHDLAALPDPGRVIFHHLLAQRADVGLDEGGSCSSSSGSPS